MSVESAKNFMQAIAQDSEFRKTLESAGDDAARSEIISGAGYSFTAQELQSLVENQVQPLNSAPDILDEAALEAVAGGGAATTDGDCGIQFFNYQSSSVE